MIVKNAHTRDGKIPCFIKNGSDRVVIASPDDLFKLGIVDVDYKKLGLTEL